MATVEKNTLFQRKNGTDTEIIYPITKKENIVDLEDNLIQWNGKSSDTDPESINIWQYIYEITRSKQVTVSFRQNAGQISNYILVVNKDSLKDNKTNPFRTEIKYYETYPADGGIGSQLSLFYITVNITISNSKVTSVVVSSVTDNLAPYLTTGNFGDGFNFVPTLNYHPATKKYVDDNVKTVSDKVTTLESKNVAELDENGKIPTSQLPSYVDDVLEFENKAAFPTTGESGKIYVAKDTNLTWRWSGTDYVEISQSIALGETSSTAFRGDYGKLAYTHAVTKKGIEQATKGLYKFKTNTEGHIIETEAVDLSDLTSLGVATRSDINSVSFMTITKTGIEVSGGNKFAKILSRNTAPDILVFLNGEKLVLGSHFTRSTATYTGPDNGYMTYLYITNDWNITTDDIIEIVSINKQINSIIIDSL
ncbi:hypothetical protein [uncultured Clostridium sp.]|uniref:hypothetical protein n=1 Tax=uncultured Clostridium sp. TaxID=59620 RepID=UPI0026E9FB7D|nr:hypothetical protein [uncultured Clostridium sp.]